jgi:hypothetical protein
MPGVLFYFVQPPKNPGLSGGFYWKSLV